MIYLDHIFVDWETRFATSAIVCVVFAASLFFARGNHTFKAAEADGNWIQHFHFIQLASALAELFTDIPKKTHMLYWFLPKRICIVFLTTGSYNTTLRAVLYLKDQNLEKFKCQISENCMFAPLCAVFLSLQGSFPIYQMGSSLQKIPETDATSSYMYNLHFISEF